MSSACVNKKKRALLIGNNDSKSRIELQFCVNDAEDLGKKLCQIDFQVTIATNQTYEEMNRIIEEFNREINAEDLVLFFFAGYGCQWKKETDENKEVTINIQRTIQKFKSRRPLATIAFLNFCSDDADDLSNIKPIRDSFVIYTWNANKSTNNRNSLLTSSLLKYITEPNLTVDEMIYDVRDDLIEETKNEQCLFRIGALRKDVYLNQSESSREQNIPFISSPINTKWLQEGMIVAGRNLVGDQLNQLSHPQGVYVDDDHQRIYVSDTKIHRIVQWNFGADRGEIVAGGNGEGNQLNQLSCPREVILDKKTDSLIICDYGNRRLVRWPRVNGSEGQIINSDIDCCGLTMSSNGDLYVSDYAKGEVRRWKKGEIEGVIVAGGNGKGREYDKLRFPTYIFVDDEETIYISDSWHHRVMKWRKDAKEGILVAGKKGYL